MLGAENAADVLEKELGNLTTAGKKLGHEIVDAGGGVEKISQGFLTASQSASKMTLASKAATLGMKALSVAMNVGIMLLVSEAINLTIKGIDYLIHYQEKLAEKTDKLRSEYLNTTDTIKSLNDELTTTQKRLDELNSKEIPLTLVEKDELSKLQNTNKELENRINLLTKEQEIKAKETNKAAEDEFWGYQHDGDYDNMYTGWRGSNADAYVSILREYNELKDLGQERTQSQQKDYEKLEFYLSEMGKKYDDIAQKIIVVDSESENLKNRLLGYVGEINLAMSPESFQLEEFNKVFNAEDFKQSREILIQNSKDGKLDESVILSYQELADIVDRTGLSAKELANEINTIANKSNSSVGQSQLASQQFDSFAALRKQYEDGTVKSDEYVDSLKKQLDTVNQLAKDNPNLADSYKLIASTIQSEINTASSTLDKLKESTNTVVSSAKNLSSAFAEQKENGKLSAETILSIVDAGYAAALSVDKETGAVTLNTAMYGEMVKAKIQAQLADIELSKIDLTQKMESERKGIEQLTLQNILLAGSYDTVSLAKLKSDFAENQDKINNLNAQSAALNNILGNINQITAGYYHVGDAAKSAANDIKQAMQTAQSDINALLDMTIKMIKQRYEDEKNRLQDQKDALQKRYDTEKDNLDEIDKKKEARYKRDREAIEDQQKTLKAKLDAELEILRLKKEEYSWDKETSESNKNISELESILTIAKRDDSQEGLARQKDLEEQLAKAKEEWADKQFDHSIEQQEDALQKEFDLADEKYQNELDNLEQIEERRKQIHQNKLDRIENEYEAEREALELKIKDIEDKTSKEALIRTEAIALIEGKSQEFHNQLMQWNLTYGDGLTSTLELAWSKGYSALETYNNGQLNVLSTLNYLAIAMDDFTAKAVEASNAVNSIQDGAGTNKFAKKSSPVTEHNPHMDERSQSYNEYKDKISQSFSEGGVDSTGGLKLMHGTPQRSEVIFNAIDANKLYNLIHNMPDAQSIMAQQMHERFEAINSSFRLNISTPPAFAGDITVNQGDVIVQGGMDKAALGDIKQALKDNSRLLKDIVCDEIMKRQYLKGHGNMVY